MTIEEAAAGPAGPKVLRLLYFVGAACKCCLIHSIYLSIYHPIQIYFFGVYLAVICTVGINKWREIERKSILEQQQQEKKMKSDFLPRSSTNSVQKAIK
jgi:hypothetical protein